ncbi:GNAT family N-acetyltransferase [Methylobacterium aquaticum]|uniref:GNAT family N-acetyltransferase n=1 Tax=Methylobacterium aquaticum TaxID=270351 RepID=UPI001AF106A0|nr:GNAT family N-acetyltransferase [Methylobacterium aquaticum]
MRHWSDEMAHTLLRVSSVADWQSYHDIRRSVLWQERGLHGYDESRPEERLLHHHPLLLRFNGRGAGTTRLDNLRDGTGIARLVAVCAALRGQGHGRILDTMVKEYANKLGLHTLFVNAAADALGFYTSTGWGRLVHNRPQLLEQADECVPMQITIVR